MESTYEGLVVQYFVRTYASPSNTAQFRLGDSSGQYSMPNLYQRWVSVFPIAWRIEVIIASRQ